MAMKMGEIRSMKEDALEKKLQELKMELIIGQGQGTKMRSIRKSIARIMSHLSNIKKHIIQIPKQTGKHPIVKSAKIVDEKSAVNSEKSKK